MGTLHESKNCVLKVCFLLFFKIRGCRKTSSRFAFIPRRTLHKTILHTESECKNVSIVHFCFLQNETKSFFTQKFALKKLLLAFICSERKKTYNAPTVLTFCELKKLIHFGVVLAGS